MSRKDASKKAKAALYSYNAEQCARYKLADEQYKLHDVSQWLGEPFETRIETDIKNKIDAGIKNREFSFSE